MMVESHRTEPISALDTQWAMYHPRAYLDLAALALPTSFPRLGVRAATRDHGEEQKHRSLNRHVIDSSGGRELANPDEYKATLTLNKGGGRHKMFEL